MYNICRSVLECTFGSPLEFFEDRCSKIWVWRIWQSVFRLWCPWTFQKSDLTDKFGNLLSGHEVSELNRGSVLQGQSLWGCVHGLWFLEGLCLRMIPAIFKVIFEAFEVCVLRFQIDAFVGMCLRCQVSQPFEHLCSIYWVSGVRICVQGISTHNSFKICGLKFECEVFGFCVQSV